MFLSLLLGVSSAVLTACMGAGEQNTNFYQLCVVVSTPA